MYAKILHTLDGHEVAEPVIGVYIDDDMILQFYHPALFEPELDEAIAGKRGFTAQNDNGFFVELKKGVFQYTIYPDGAEDVKFATRISIPFKVMKPVYQKMSDRNIFYPASGDEANSEE